MNSLFQPVGGPGCATPFPAGVLLCPSVRVAQCHVPAGAPTPHLGVPGCCRCRAEQGEKNARSPVGATRRGRDGEGDSRSSSRSRAPTVKRGREAIKTGNSPSPERGESAQSRRGTAQWFQQHQARAVDSPLHQLH